MTLNCYVLVYLELLYPNLNLFVAGDLNLPKINWDLLTTVNDGVHDILLNTFIDNCLKQMVLKPTRLNNILDIFLTNVPQLVFDCTLYDKLGSSDHESVLIQIYIPLIQIDPTLLKTSSMLDTFISWNNTSVAHAQDYLYNYNWSNIFNVNNHPRTVWSNFCFVLNDCIANTARIIRVKQHKTKPPHNPVLKRLFSLKSATWRMLRAPDLGNEKALILRKKYKAIVTRINLVILNSRKVVESKLINDGDVKKFYAYANSKLQNRSQIHSLKDSHGNIINDHLTIASIFNECFSAAFTIDNQSFPINTLPFQHFSLIHLLHLFFFLRHLYLLYLAILKIQEQLHQTDSHLTHSKLLVHV